MKNFPKSLFLTVCLLTLFQVKVDARPLHEIHSMMIYNFAKYIQWPNMSGEIVIGVIGDDQVYNTLNEWYHGKTRQSKLFTIKKFNDVSEVEDCHIIYLGTSALSQFEAIKQKTHNKPILSISNKKGLGHKGSLLNFRDLNGRLGFEINRAVLKKSKLKVSQELIRMAVLI